MIHLDGAAGHDDRFEALYRTYYARVWRFYRTSRVSDDEAHDLAQDAFQRFYQSHYHGDAPWPYLQATARNVLYNWLRARKTMKRTCEIVDIDDPELPIDPAAPEGPDYAQREEEERLRALLRQAIADLPPGQRDCVMLWVQGFNYDEIARTLRITPDAVKSRLRDAKKHLRTRLGRTR